MKGQVVINQALPLYSLLKSEFFFNVSSSKADTHVFVLLCTIPSLTFLPSPMLKLGSSQLLMAQTLRQQYLYPSFKDANKQCKGTIMECEILRVGVGQKSPKSYPPLNPLILYTLHLSFKFFF